ncbi:hypothetical protein JI747_003280 [Chryseobacterium sp. RG1]|uniref:YD repeat-containing protein n=1 Tax=Chryseobacterium tagetis TaxID=2801334 RepID=A0ABS7ZWU2_9FLAO|nr:hypothetical protein [Chryseobacterium tagetis]MCA6066186.1 hypothetical protein [Chryseobacterium tagetis]
MKKIVTAISLIALQISFAQSIGEPQIKTDLPEIIPPSPTMASLMKFEEVPVNNYTGVPDITIPLISVPTHSKDINLNFSLKYHSGDVQADNVAGETGLGWSLISGGNISRTVRGLPDEAYVVGTTIPKTQIGIYQNNTAGYLNNHYYDIFPDYVNYTQNNPEIANKFYYEASEFGTFDTEHDLWQFNFMGQTGRFYIKKNASGILEIQPLSDFRLRIINRYDTIGNTPFTPTGFTIYDEKGYRYEFDVFDISKKAGGSQATAYPGGLSNGVTTTSNLYEEKEFRSAFHLTKVFDNNNSLLLEYKYSTNDYQETNRMVNYTINDFGSDTSSLNILKRFNCFSELPPLQKTDVSFFVVKTKKIDTVEILDQAKIKYTYATGRTDSNINNTASVYLQKLDLQTWNNQSIKQFEFEYEYFNTIENRMFLKTLKQLIPNELPLEYSFTYNRPVFAFDSIGKDFWGFFNATQNNCSQSNLLFMNEPNPLASTLDLLQKIKYPTGGATVFTFETNQYSFVGDQEVTDYSSTNNQTVYVDAEMFSFNAGTSSQQYIPVSNVKRKVKFYPSIVISDLSTATRKFSIDKIVNGQTTSFYESGFCLNNTCCIDLDLEKDVQYVIKWHNFDLNYTGTDTMSLHYYNYADNNNQFLYGGGNRISKISYYENNPPIQFGAVNSNIVPAKEKKFEYNWLDNPYKSSGSLVFGKPYFNENRFVKMMTTCPEVPWDSFPFSLQETVTYTSRRNFTPQQIGNTQGAFVGYKYVNVYETGKGNIKQEYTSPLDYPDLELITYTKPYLPSKNIDYKRGLLLKESIFNNDNKILSQSINTYSFVDYESTPGYRLDKMDGIGFNGQHFKSYAEYKFSLEGTNPTIYNSCLSGNCNSFSQFNLAGYPAKYIKIYPLIEAYGWTKLSSKNTKNYFYNNGIQKATEKNESFIYNAVNKQLAEHSVITEEGSALTTKYYYHSGNSVYSQNRISEIEKIESYQDGKLIDNKKVDYNNSWSNNVSYLPSQIQSSFGNGALETELTYDKYDSKGNLEQYTTKNGVSTTIIWGYNKTQPIAKIDGAQLSDISQSLIDLIVNASDSDAAAGTNNDETTLLNALNDFRNSYLRHFITTYTYDPLVGVRSITPPSGIREVYIYDSANRLKEVREQNQSGKLLKEYQYNYKH